MKIKNNPAVLVLIGFAGVIVIGTILLSLPFMRAAGRAYSFVDILFTATSCVCVTGLTVVNICDHYSLAGQLVIMLLIQIGGLGYMTIASMIFLMVGKKLSIKERMATQTSVGQFSLHKVTDFVKYVVKLTLVIEIIGALLLFLAWFPVYGIKSIYYAIFHSISAFCNAGFTLFSDSLSSSADNTVVILTISFLIIIGGIGFIVVQDIKTRFKKKRFSYHAKIVLILTSFFVLVPAIIFLCSEYSNPHTIGMFGFWKKILISFFHSVTTRTAGFNIIDINGFLYMNVFIMFILMFIGASPGGTGGGIKTTTFAVLFSSIRAMLRGTYEVDMYKRRVDEQVVQKSWIIFFLALFLVALMIFLILAVEGMAFRKVFFEVISAFGTVGLSMGVTSSLSWIGKLLIIITMFFGRLGPLTLGTTIYFKQEKLRYRFAEEKILIG
ncbi:TrkH family potassium uptake protein [bacterium]